MQTSTKLKKFVGAALITVLMFAGMYFAYRYLHRNDPLCKNCNVVVVDIDVLRADELPCYGYARNTAPVLCRFAGQSFVFKQNYSQSYWTLPSTFSTITSLYPWAHGVNTMLVDRLSPAVTTMGELFRANGYRAVFAGPKTLAGLNDDNGGNRGYDSFSPFPFDPYTLKTLSDLQNKHQPFLFYFYLPDLHMPYFLDKDGDQIENLPKPGGFPITKKEFSVVLGNYLRANYKSIFTEKALREFAGVFADTSPDASAAILNIFNTYYDTSTQAAYLQLAWSPVRNAYMQFIDKNNPNHVAYLRMLYDTNITGLDKRLSPLLTLLSSPQFAKNTIVVIMSDHGESFGEHGSFSHNSDPYTELYYTPLFIRVPGQKPNVTNAVSSNIDILPTLLSLVGQPVLPQAQGTSLTPIILGHDPGEHRYSIGGLGSDDVLIIQDAEWTLLWRKALGGPSPIVELYNKISDPKEIVNLASLPQYKNQAEKLFLLLKKARNSTAFPSAAPSARPTWMDEKTIERLKKEGYF